MSQQSSKLISKLSNRSVLNSKNENNDKRVELLRGKYLKKLELVKQLQDENKELKSFKEKYEQSIDRETNLTNELIRLKQENNEKLENDKNKEKNIENTKLFIFKEINKKFDSQKNYFIKLFNKILDEFRNDINYYQSYLSSDDIKEKEFGIKEISGKIFDIDLQLKSLKNKILKDSELNTIELKKNDNEKSELKKEKYMKNELSENFKKYNIEESIKNLNEISIKDYSKNDFKILREGNFKKEKNLNIRGENKIDKKIIVKQSISNYEMYKNNSFSKQDENINENYYIDNSNSKFSESKEYNEYNEINDYKELNNYKDNQSSEELKYKIDSISQYDDKMVDEEFKKEILNESNHLINLENDISYDQVEIENIKDRINNLESKLKQF